MCWNKNIQKFNIWDLVLIELYSVVFVLFVISKWTTLAVYAISVDWWWYLGAFVILAFRPIRKLVRK